MCGIAGLLMLPGPSSPLPGSADSAIAGRMAARIAHRGPDAINAVARGPVALAVARLAIVDLPGGGQPMGAESGRRLLAYNGEVYNFPEIRAELQRLGLRLRTTSDTEVVLRSLAHWGADALKRFDGMFALAFWDAEKGRLLLARDPLGQKPLYYARCHRTLFFASETRALLPELENAPLSPAGVDDALAALAPCAPRSAFAGVRALEPGHVVEFDADGAGERPASAPKGSVAFASRRYWRCNPRPRARGGFQAAVDEAQRLLSLSVSRSLRADVPAGVLLSGGVDSGIVAALAARSDASNDRDLTAFTAGFSDADYDERPVARETAQRLGLALEEVDIPVPDRDQLDRVIFAFDGPFADSSAIAMDALCRMASQTRKTALSGDGGDEVFGGYRRYRARLLADRYNRLPHPLRWAARRVAERVCTGLGALDGSRARGVVKFVRSADRWLREPASSAHFGFNVQERRALMDAAVLEPACETDRARRFRRLAHLEPAHAQLWLDLETYLPDDLLVKTDRISMAHSLEVRAPLLSPAVVEFAAGLPRPWLFTAGRSKILLRAVAERLGLGHVARRPKQGFGVPMGRWIAGPLREVFRESLLGGDGPLLGGDAGPAFNATAIRALLDRHLARREDLGEQLWTLYVMARWRARARASQGAAKEEIRCPASGSPRSS